MVSGTEFLFLVLQISSLFPALLIKTTNHLKAAAFISFIKKNTLSFALYHLKAPHMSLSQSLFN